LFFGPPGAGLIPSLLLTARARQRTGTDDRHEHEDETG
jgi:hypothetical protein